MRRLRAANPRKRVEVWAEDEARLGLKPITRRVWWLKGCRPRSSGRTRYEWLYVYGFARPRTGETFTAILPRVNVERMAEALAAFAAHADPGGRKVLVLVTDGEHNVPAPALTPRQAAQLAAGLRVPVYVIDAGGERSAAEPPAEGAGATAGNREEVAKVLRAVAGLSKGRYFAAHDTEALLAVCREIDRVPLAQLPVALAERRPHRIDDHSAAHATEFAPASSSARHRNTVASPGRWVWPAERARLAR